MSVSADAVRAQIDRVVRSKAFEASEVHRHLLQYLAEKSLSGEAERLKEYVIGLEAFGKPPSYDPKHDSIVRLQAGRLRQKLTAYYQTEGTGDTVIVTLPKGGFKLDVKEALEVAEPVRESGPRFWSHRKIAIGMAGALLGMTLWAAVATVQLVRLKHETAGAVGRWNPELESIWAPFLESNRTTLICLGTPLFVRFPNLGFFRDPRSNDWQDIQKSDRITEVRKAYGAAGEIIPWYAYTGAGEASAAVLVSNLLSTRKQEISLTRSNLLSWEQLVDDNVVFIGPPKFNLQLESASLAQDIVIEADGIRNLKPRPGEPAFLEDHMVAGKLSEGETHALISSLPGPSGTGHLLVVAGNASADTLAAGQWLTEPWRASELARHLRTKSGALPRYYQVVLKVAFKQGIPVKSSYVLHHVIEAPAPPVRK
jgi:hypothetical protein